MMDIVYPLYAPDPPFFVNNVYYTVNNVYKIYPLRQQFVLSGPVLQHWHGSCTFRDKDIEIKIMIRSKFLGKEISWRCKR